MHMDNLSKNIPPPPCPTATVETQSASLSKMCVDTVTSDNLPPSTINQESNQPSTVSAVTTRFQQDTDLVRDMTNRLASEQRKDTFLRELNKKIIKSDDGQVQINDEIYYKKSGIIHAKHAQTLRQRLVAPQQMTRDIILSAHSPGHLGIAKTIDRIKNKWYFPGIMKKVKDVIRSCHTCQQFRAYDTAKNPHQTPPSHLTKARRPGDIIAIDV